MFDKLAYAHGQPQYTGEIKQTPEDFIVKEDLGFDLTGEGEHVCVQVQKKAKIPLGLRSNLQKSLGSRRAILVGQALRIGMQRRNNGLAFIYLENLLQILKYLNLKMSLL